MKKLKLFMIIVPLIFFITGCGTEEEKIPEVKEEPKITSTPLLFEATKEGSDTKLYLFGSIHAAKEDLYPFPDYVINAYKDSDAIAVEFDIIEYASDLKSQLEFAQKMVLQDGKSIIDYIGKDTYEKAVTILKNAKLYSNFYYTYHPVMWYSLLSNAMVADAKLDTNYGVDSHIIRKAKEDNKDIIELESFDYQMNMLLDVDSNIMSLMILGIVEIYDESVKNMEELYDSYSKGDLDKLKKLLHEDSEIPDGIKINDDEKKLLEKMEEFNYKFLNGRNKGMFEKLNEYYNSGKNVFCTVGSAHIIGEESVIDLLKAEGYNIKQVK